jgi:F-type H+-transporting ATPase subunit epsilon
VNALDFCFDISKIIEISLVFIYLSMQLKIISMNQIAFSGHVDEVIIPTEIGEISILPDHQPLTSIVRPGLVGIIPAQPTDTWYVIDQDMIKISVGSGVVQVIDDEIVILTAMSVVTPTQSKEVLEKLYADTQADLASIDVQTNPEALEKALHDMEVIDAELRLARIAGVSRI